jgi:hypothetical protein
MNGVKLGAVECPHDTQTGIYMNDSTIKIGMYFSTDKIINEVVLWNNSNLLIDTNIGVTTHSILIGALGVKPISYIKMNTSVNDYGMYNSQMVSAKVYDTNENTILVSLPLPVNRGYNSIYTYFINTYTGPNPTETFMLYMGATYDVITIFRIHYIDYYNYSGMFYLLKIVFYAILLDALLPHFPHNFMH